MATPKVGLFKLGSVNLSDTLLVENQRREKGRAAHFRNGLALGVRIDRERVPGTARQRRDDLGPAANQERAADFVVRVHFGARRPKHRLHAADSCIIEMRIKGTFLCSSWLASRENESDPRTRSSSDQNCSLQAARRVSLSVSTGTAFRLYPSLAWAYRLMWTSAKMMLG